MINEYENTLRRLIINIIGSEDSSIYKVPLERVEKWKEKREIEIKKNKGVVYEKRLLYYSDFYDLKTIVDKNWVLFLPILHNKKRFEAFYCELENYRNTIAHGRNLTSSQECLLKGILSDLKNLITIYHNKNEMKDDYFIRILKINDNLGNIWEKSVFGPKPILRVGDDYELLIEANDPKEREIEYVVSTLSLSLPKLDLKQKTNRFTFKIEKWMVSQNFKIYIKAKTPDSTYNNEDLTSIDLMVLPEE